MVQEVRVSEPVFNKSLIKNNVFKITFKKNCALFKKHFVKNERNVCTVKNMCQVN